MAEESSESQMAFASRLAELSTVKIKERRARFSERLKAAANDYINSLETAMEESERALEDRYGQFKQEEAELNESIAEDWQAIAEIYGQLQKGMKQLSEHIFPLQAETVAKVDECLRVVELLCREEEQIFQECYACAIGNGKNNSVRAGQHSSPRDNQAEGNGGKPTHQG
ncbi:hypothetical protein ACQY0O_001675 [Thecaphora frezii]